MDLSQFGVEFPFMGRSEHEVFISGNGCKLRPFRIRSPASQQSWLPADISFSGDQTGDSGQSSNPETTTIPSDDAKPDDAIFVYWTDLDFSNGGEIYISAESEPGQFADSVTITWCDCLPDCCLPAPHLDTLSSRLPLVAGLTRRISATDPATTSGRRTPARTSKAQRGTPGRTASARRRPSRPLSSLTVGSRCSTSPWTRTPRRHGRRSRSAWSPRTASVRDRHCIAIALSERV